MLVLGVDIGARGSVARRCCDRRPDRSPRCRCWPTAPRAGPRSIPRCWPSRSHLPCVRRIVRTRLKWACRGVCVWRMPWGRRGVLGAVGVPATHLTPAARKRAVGIIPAGKEGAKGAPRSEAVRRWPTKFNSICRSLAAGFSVNQREESKPIRVNRGLEGHCLWGEVLTAKNSGKTAVAYNPFKYHK